MSDFMKTVLLWAVIILVISYLFGIDLITVINNVVHAVQTIHNSHGK